MRIFEACEVAALFYKRLCGRQEEFIDGRRVSKDLRKVCACVALSDSESWKDVA